LKKKKTVRISMKGRSKVFSSDQMVEGTSFFHGIMTFFLNQKSKWKLFFGAATPKSTISLLGNTM